MLVTLSLLKYHFFLSAQYLGGVAAVGNVVTLHIALPYPADPLGRNCVLCSCGHGHLVKVLYRN
jgi:hypothetical protein